MGLDPRSGTVERVALTRPVALAALLAAAILLWAAERAIEARAVRDARNEAASSAQQLAIALGEKGVPVAHLLGLVAREADGAAVYAPFDGSATRLRLAERAGRFAMPLLTDRDALSAATWDDAIVASAPIGDGARVVAVARSLASVPAGTARELAWVAAALAAFVLVVLGTIRVLQRGLSTAIAQVLAGMAHVTNGHLGERIRVERIDALGTLAQRFNTMTRAVEDSRREAAEQSRALERRVTERTAELQRANHTLRTLDQAKDAFLANVSHELRTPLTAILASTEVLRDVERADPRTLNEFVSIIDLEARRLLDLIGSALMVAETESALPALRRLPTDVVRLCEEVVEACRTRCKERGVSVVRRFDTEDPVLRCDTAHVAAALECLLDNAAKFSPRGATVELIVRDEADGVAIQVRDEGPGVPEHERNRIFEKFTQAGSSLTDKPRGFGLGLPLSRRIAQAHGGAVEYLETPGWGACFVLRLPRGIARQRPWAETREETRLADAATPIVSLAPLRA